MVRGVIELSSCRSSAWYLNESLTNCALLDGSSLITIDAMASSLLFCLHLNNIDASSTFCSRWCKSLHVCWARDGATNAHKRIFDHIQHRNSLNRAQDTLVNCRQSLPCDNDNIYDLNGPYTARPSTAARQPVNASGDVAIPSDDCGESQDGLPSRRGSVAYLPVTLLLIIGRMALEMQRDTQQHPDVGIDELRLGDCVILRCLIESWTTTASGL